MDFHRNCYSETSRKFDYYTRVLNRTSTSEHHEMEMEEAHLYRTQRFATRSNQSEIRTRHIRLPWIYISYDRKLARSSTNFSMVDTVPYLAKTCWVCTNIPRKTIMTTRAISLIWQQEVQFYHPPIRWRHGGETQIQMKLQSEPPNDYAHRALQNDTFREARQDIVPNNVVVFWNFRFQILPSPIRYDKSRRYGTAKFID